MIQISKINYAHQDSCVFQVHKLQLRQMVLKERNVMQVIIVKKVQLLKFNVQQVLMSQEKVHHHQLVKHVQQGTSVLLDQQVQLYAQ